MFSKHNRFPNFSRPPSSIALIMAAESSDLELTGYLLQSRCVNVTLSFTVVYAYTGVRFLLLLPSSVFILYLGQQQWRQRGARPQSHLDVFTFHLAVLQLLWGLGNALFYGALDLPALSLAGLYLMNIMFVGETLFHVFTCLDRYLAVVHPVTYKKLQNSHGVTVRNVCALLTWLFSFLWSHLTQTYYPKLPVIQFFCFLVFSLVVVSFFSFSVLRALVRPGPGERERDRKHVDQMKQRAFCTVTAITGVLCFWFLGFIVATSLRESNMFGTRVSCLLHKSVQWFSLPSSLVLQLLFLHKKGKFSCQSRRA